MVKNNAMEIDFKEISNIYTEAEAIGVFKNIANALFCEYILVSNGYSRYKLNEIEFYLYSDRHPDTTCHRADRQNMRGRWYVHRFGRSGDSKYATFSPKVGLDICLGAENIALGVLLRGIQNIETNEIISGPIKVLNRLYGAENAYIQGSGDFGNYIKYSRKIEEMWVFEKNDLLYLEKIFPNRNGEIVFKPRTGINMERHGDFAGHRYRAVFL